MSPLSNTPLPSQYRLVSNGFHYFAPTAIGQWSTGTCDLAYRIRLQMPQKQTYANCKLKLICHNTKT